MTQSNSSISYLLAFSGALSQGSGEHYGIGRFQIYVVGVDGSGLRRVSHNPDADETNPSWSPGGQYLAYATAIVTAQATTGDIICVLADGSSPQSLTGRTGRNSPRWMPNSQQVLYCAPDEGGGEGYWRLVDANGHAGRRLFALEEAIISSTSPDGTAFAVTKRGQFNAFQIVTDAGEMVEEFVDEHEFLRDPIWSSDGDAIAFAATNGEAGDVEGLYVLDRRTRDIRQVGQMAFEAGFAWSPDGQRLAFVGPGGDGQIAYETVYLVQRDGIGLHPLVNLNLDDMSGEIPSSLPAWSPDGQYLAVSTYVDDAFAIDIYTVDGRLDRRLSWPDQPFALIYDVAWQPYRNIGS